MVIFTIILNIIINILCLKRNDTEGFTPNIRQIYRPYMRNIRTYIEPFYGKYYRIKEYMNKIHL